MVHYRVVVTGKVQGVFFRKYTAEEATRQGLAGFVRNERDGSVYIEVEGPEEKVKAFIQWCWKGSPSSRVDDVIAEEDSPGGYADFRVDR